MVSVLPPDRVRKCYGDGSDLVSFAVTSDYDVYKKRVSKLLCHQAVGSTICIIFQSARCSRIGSYGAVNAGHYVVMDGGCAKAGVVGASLIQMPDQISVVRRPVL